MDPSENSVSLNLAGDVMLGRGVDQALANSCHPELREPYVKDAREYLRIAEERNGSLDAPLGPEEPWGAALQALRAEGAPHFIINLENAVTADGEYWPEKGIHYRMHPYNLDVLKAAGVDCCVLANNHALDFGRTGLEESLHHLLEAGITVAGAGRTLPEARAVRYLPAPGAGAGESGGAPGSAGAPGIGQPRTAEVAILAACFPDSGVPHLWEAEEGRSGIFFLREPGEQAAESVVDALQEVPERVPRILSVHWGSNWGYEVSEKHRRFARALIESDTVDLLFGHSSHHPKEVEVYRERVIIYGAGDLINDYEGIRGHREYRPDLGLLYTVALRRGAVLRLEATPLRRRRFRLEGASAEDARFLSGVLSKDGRVSEVTIGDAGRLQINLGPR